jgi:hypothetical protein
MRKAPALASFAVPPRDRFQEAEYRSASLPALDRFHRFGSVSAATDWQGLDAPFIVELFTVCVFGRTPEEVTFRLLGVATGRLPTPAHVPRTCRALHPIGLAALVPVPWGD